MMKILKGRICRLSLKMNCLLAMAGCSQEALTPANPVSESETIEKEVTIRMSDPEIVDVRETTETKTYLYQYDTVGVSKEHAEGKWYRVGWTVGDRTECYCQTGVFMDYIITDEDILSEGFPRQNAKTHVIYRYGDSWLTVYCRGPKIGAHIGFRERDRLVLSDGIPNRQNGKFEDCHICLARNNPDADFVFENMQAYIRFEITEDVNGDRLGRLLGYPVTKVTCESLTSRDKMSGNLEIIDDGGWRTRMVDRGIDADRVITVIPETGRFEPSTETSLKSYFVAVPARRYADGIRFNLYTDNGVDEDIRGFVDLPGMNISRNQILNAHDLLKYCAIYAQSLSFSYGGTDKIEDRGGVVIAVGHKGKVDVVFDPVSTTDKALTWEIVPGSESPAGVLTLNQDGSIIANKIGYARIRATTKDGSNVSKELTVTVVADSGLGPGDYSHAPYSW